MEVHIGNASYRNDAWEEAKGGKKYAIFREDTLLNKHKTEEAGRPIYDPVVLIERIIPGDSLNRPVRPIREADKQEFPQEWAAFKEKRENQIPGTPLEVVPWLSRSQCAEYKALNIFTVEQLATLPESVASRIMGFQQVRSKAENFLKAAQDSAYLEKMKAAETEAKAREEAKDAEISDLKARLSALEGMLGGDEARRGPGRPRKEAVG